MRVIESETVNDILNLCRKVEEVINNNDWPTEEGHPNEYGDCPLQTLINSIKLAM